MLTQKGFNLGNNTPEQFTEFKNDWTPTSQVLRLTGHSALLMLSTETFPADFWSGRWESNPRHSAWEPTLGSFKGFTCVSIWDETGTKISFFQYDTMSFRFVAFRTVSHAAGTICACPEAVRPWSNSKWAEPVDACWT
jgi:hypothetical protein